MDLIAAGDFKANDLLFLAVTALVASGSSLAVFIVCYQWFRRDQRPLQNKILAAIANARREPDEFFLTGKTTSASGELVARFKVNHGRQVVSVLEADGRRFVHFDGELSARERRQMIRYLKSEGFMS